MRAGITLLTKPNEGPVTKLAAVGVAAFSTLKTSTSILSRRPVPSLRSLLALRFRMFCAEALGAEHSEPQGQQGSQAWHRASA
ncbi:MAG TPA: hypothetical protein VK504_01725, partial [Vicinamibacterales bacterium]|nr:hypothetical protein [Vicinamibacterales bacterium]